MAYDYDDQNIFAKILRGEIPNRTVLETDHSLAFEDIRPQAPVHVLVIPKGPYVTYDHFAAEASDAEILDFTRAVAKLCAELGVAEADGGYRLISNAFAEGGQEVPHMHVHILGGRPLGPMLTPQSMKVGIHLSFDGDCGEAFDFYARVLGGSVDRRQTYGETTLAGDMDPAQHCRIFHARLRFGEQQILGSDAPPGWRTPPGGYALAVDVDDPAEGARLFDALAEGGSVRLAFAPTVWARGFGLLADRYGVQWTVSCG